jgi:ABC-2 type transport system ATP-binding protein
MAPIIEINNLTKRYGSRVAVDDLSLTVEEGDIYGFVGPNGAGKTSTIRVITTLMRQTSGTVRVVGEDVQKNPKAVRAAIGYMPDFFGVYNDMKVWEYLDFFGACYQIPEGERAVLIGDLLELVDLAHRRDDWVDKLSRGMKQRLSLARTLLHDPKILILDEPASGLDPRARVEIRELLVELAKLGKTIFFSTHILSDVSEICTRVGIIEEGKMIASGGIEELQQIIVPNRIIELTLLAQAEEAQAALTQLDSVSNIHAKPATAENARARLEFEFQGTDQMLSDLLGGLIQQGLPVLSFHEESRDLEEVFMRITKGVVS